ncbi:hypothetical protein PISMIDRAFT_13267 [Pisolithus microcarpus 441]|uniref:Unplaced genomic scaffold scaffold_89, whole genome shotgun sequence n=1 Tax=Pisolithus microcarpus 441 TaxID=765257 RepID=A0A0C9ZJ90_9AGAM|nr:hypothetical protein PISMIDRAFT_13267 [Pisolithus microcarpus 441]
MSTHHSWTRWRQTATAITTELKNLALSAQQTYYEQECPLRDYSQSPDRVIQIGLPPTSEGVRM